jgi:hypothetical protein
MCCNCTWCICSCIFQVSWMWREDVWCCLVSAYDCNGKWRKARILAVQFQLVSWDCSEQVYNIGSSKNPFVLSDCFRAKFYNTRCVSHPLMLRHHKYPTTISASKNALPGQRKKRINESFRSGINNLGIFCCRRKSLLSTKKCIFTWGRSEDVHSQPEYLSSHQVFQQNSKGKIN